MAPEATDRRRLGRELRKARTRAGVTQAAAAELLGCGQAKINKIETTLVEISLAELDRLLDAYRVDAAKSIELRRLADDDRRRPRPRSERRTSAFRELSDLELDAAEILCWYRGSIPGPLQSELYMLSQHNADTKPTSAVVHLIREHNARTRIFTADGQRRYRAILSESSLHWMPGGGSPERVLDQVEHLQRAVRSYPRLRLQIMTFKAAIRAMHTDFVVVRFPGDESSFAYIEYPGGARNIKKIEPFVKHWRELHNAALSPEESLDYLDRLAKETRDQMTTR